MSTVTLSPKYQVVIPKAVREGMDIHPGEKFEVISFDGRIELVRIKAIQEMKGFLSGFDMEFQREKEDRI
jgi:AbrB family looped-hinge helix DNA binding protein